MYLCPKSNKRANNVFYKGGKKGAIIDPKSKNKWAICQGCKLDKLVILHFWGL